MTTAPAVPTVKAPRRSWYKRNEIAVTPWLFLAPAMLFFAFYVIWPIYQSIVISFYDWDGLGEARYVGLGNYVELMDDSAFEVSLWNNLKWLLFYLLAYTFATVGAFGVVAWLGRRSDEHLDVDQWSGLAARSASVSYCQAEVQNSVVRSGPPKAGQVVCGAGNSTSRTTVSSSRRLVRKRTRASISRSRFLP